MDKIITRTLISAITTAFLVSAFTVTAATTPEIKDDGSAISTSETPQIKQKNKIIDKKISNKSMKNSMNNKPIGTTTNACTTKGSKLQPSSATGAAPVSKNTRVFKRHLVIEA
jgi:hypothetical protein